MIIDYRNDEAHARNYDVIDAATGESLSGLKIFYADDAAGLIGCYRQDADGVLVVNHDAGEIEREWHNRAIRIVPKASAAPEKVTFTVETGYLHARYDETGAKRLEFRPWHRPAVAETATPAAEAKPETWRDRPPLL
jgi:hypothetical protein